MFNIPIIKTKSDVQSGFQFLEAIGNESNPTAATTIDIVPRATHIILQAVGGDIWFTLDGTTPVVDGASFKLIQDAPFIVLPVNSGITLKVITDNLGDLKYLSILAFS